ncbi:hypothetical protein D3C87_1926550 [compost metagenome]
MTVMVSVFSPTSSGTAFDAPETALTPLIFTAVVVAAVDGVTPRVETPLATVAV